MHLELFKIQIVFLLNTLMNPEKESPVKSASVNNKNTIQSIITTNSNRLRKSCLCCLTTGCGIADFCFCIVTPMFH